MLETITSNIEGIVDHRSRHFLRRILLTGGDRYSSQPMTTAGLVISSGGAATAKIGATDFYACANGVIVKIAAGTAMPALTGINNTAAYFNVACFFVDNAGTVTVLGGTQGASLGTVKWPLFPYKKSLVGYLIITYASAFTGGTTPLDTATTIYVSPTGAFDPSFLP
jgi:hypothetical protein